MFARLNGGLRIEIEDLTSRNHKSRTIKMPAPFQTLHIDIMRKQSPWMLQSAEFQAPLGT